jgi:hypothetical protein
MEQRVYRGKLSAEELTERLVQYFAAQPDVQAQRFQGGDGWLVQIGTGDSPATIRHAMTLAVVSLPEDAPGLRVTLGQQQWLTPDEAGNALIWALVAAMTTPWVLFLMLLPLREALRATPLHHAVWEQVDAYATAHGATRETADRLQHPVAG